LKEVEIVQKEKMLSELYCGRLMPAEKSVVPGSEYQNSSSGLSSLKKKLKPC